MREEHQMISFVGIHVLIPLLGLTVFVLLRKMRRTIQSPPFVSYLSCSPLSVAG